MAKLGKNEQQLGVSELPPSRFWLWIALGVTAATYAATLSYPFIYDDISLIVSNPKIQSWNNFSGIFSTHLWSHVGDGINANFYRPMVFVWALLTHSAGGMNPVYWHVSAVMVHLIVTYLLYRVGVQLGMQPATAGVAALLFGIHPVHIENVAWITGSNDPLMAMFLLLSFLFYLKIMEKQTLSFPDVLLFSFFMLCGLWSKEGAVCYPVILLAHAILVFDRSKITWNKIIGITSGAIVVTVIYSVMRYHTLAGFSHTVQRTTWPIVLMTIPSGLWIYLHNLLVPFPIAIFYGTPFVTSMMSRDFWWPVLALSTIAVAIGLIAWRYDTKSRRWFMFGSAAVLLPLALPLASVAYFGDADFVHDRYCYFTSIAFCLLAAAGIQKTSAVWSRIAERARGTSETLHSNSLRFGMLTMCLAVFYASATVMQESQWSDTLVLFSHAVQVSPRSTIAHVMLGHALMDKGDRTLARKMYEKAFLMDPNSVNATQGLANIRQLDGDLTDAEQLLRHEIALDDRYFTTHSQLAEVQYQRGKVQAATETLQVAIVRWPNAPSLHYALGFIFAKEGRKEEALTSFEKELQISPNDQRTRTAMSALK